MNILYDTSIGLYSLLLKAVSPFNKKAKFWCDGRKNIIARLREAFKDEKRPVAWFHCASLGEFEQGRSVIERFKACNEDYALLVTFFSPSGYEVRKNYEGADYIFYLPADTMCNVRRFLDIVNPKMAIFIKYEFWVNYLSELRRRDIDTYIVSAIFRPTQLFFKNYGGAYRKVLSSFNHIFVQNRESKALLDSIGLENVTVCGDTRFDRVYKIASENPSMPLFERFAEGSKVFISGSSWEPDDEITLRLIDDFRDIKFIIAPHEMSESKISKLVSAIVSSGRSVVRYTQITDEQSAAACDVIILDTIGILSKVYRYCNYCYIGGGFGVGIHNTLEAATFGLPMIFGPNYLNFMEAVTLAQLKVATPIDNQKEAIAWLRKMSTNELLYSSTSKRCKEYVEENIGACDIIIEHIMQD